MLRNSAKSHSLAKAQNSAENNKGTIGTQVIEMLSGRSARYYDRANNNDSCGGGGTALLAARL